MPCFGTFCTIENPILEKRDSYKLIPVLLEIHEINTKVSKMSVKSLDSHKKILLMIFPNIMISSVKISWVFPWQSTRKIIFFLYPYIKFSSMRNILGNHSIKTKNLYKKISLRSEEYAWYCGYMSVFWNYRNWNQ